MDLLIIVSSRQTGIIVGELGKAAQRAGKDWSVFFTGEGVCTLGNPDFAQIIATAAKAVACGDSWRQHMGDVSCPIETGSQTSNSAMVGEAEHIVSL